MILPGDLVERLDPSPSAHQALFIEYEELAFVVDVIVDLVPRCNHDAMGVEPHLRRFFFPGNRITNLGGCDDH